MSANTAKMIAVIGATGHQGGSVVRALQAGGKFRVRALTRDPGKYGGIADEVVAADLNRPETLKSAFEGAYGVFAVTNFWEQGGADEVTQGEAAVRAAKDVGVEHFVWSTLPNVEAISGGKYNVPHFTNKAKVNAIVSAAWFRFNSFVIPPFFYQNLQGVMAPQPQQDGSTGWTLPMDPTARVIHAGDITELGRIVAGAFANPDVAGSGHYLPLVGDVLSFNDIVATLNKQGHAYTFHQVPRQVFATLFPGAGELAEMFGYFEDYTYLGRKSDARIALANKVAGAPPTDFATWARSNMAVKKEDYRPDAVKAVNPKLAHGTTTAAAFQVIARTCLIHLLSNERILRSSQLPDVLHQMRVAIRRLRAAISLFKDIVADEQREGLKSELKWIFSQLGEARDLDVFRTTVLDPVQRENPEAASLIDFARRHDDQCGIAYRHVLDAADSPRFQILLLNMAAWIEAGPWLTSEASLARARRDEDVRTFAERELTRRRKKVRKQGQDLANLDVAARHRMRIDTKKLRYAVEFFASLFEYKRANKRRKALFSALEQIQSSLGDLNDVAISQKIRQVPAHLGSGPDHEDLDRETERLIAAHQAHKTDASIASAIKAYEIFADTKPFWS